MSPVLPVGRTGASAHTVETKGAVKVTFTVRMVDSFHGKRTTGLPFELLRENGLDTVMTLARQSYDSRGLATSAVLGLSYSLPVFIEAVADRALVLPLLPKTGEIVGSEGIVAIAEVEVV